MYELAPRVQQKSEIPTIGFNPDAGYHADFFGHSLAGGNGGIVGLVALVILFKMAFPRSKNDFTSRMVEESFSQDKFQLPE